MNQTRRFPHPRQADENGIVAIGGDLYPETLLEAYDSGIFPWPIDNYPLTWFSPDPRAVLLFEQLHIPKRLKRFLKQQPFDLTINQAFDEVIENCASIPRGQGGTWITPEMIRAYRQLHSLGHAISAEAWSEGHCVGGIYAVRATHYVSAESMFFRQSNASKAAFLHLIDFIQSEMNFHWMDIQMLTPHMEAFGAIEISQEAFLKKIGYES